MQLLTSELKNIARPSTLKGLAPVLGILFARAQTSHAGDAPHDESDSSCYLNDAWPQ